MSNEDWDDRVERGYAKQKARFYAEPRFAGMVGFVLGVGVTLLAQMFFF